MKKAIWFNLKLNLNFKCGCLPVEVMLLNAVGISSNVIFVPADVAYFLTTRPTVTQILQT